MTTFVMRHESRNPHQMQWRKCRPKGRKVEGFKETLYTCKRGGKCVEENQKRGKKEKVKRKRPLKFNWLYRFSLLANACSFVMFTAIAEQKQALRKSMLQVKQLHAQTQFLVCWENVAAITDSLNLGQVHVEASPAGLWHRSVLCQAR